MNKWYRRAWVKGILIAAAHIGAVMTVVAVFYLAMIEANTGTISLSDKKSYEDSEAFQSALHIGATDALQVYYDQQSYDANSIVLEEGNTNLTYLLADLENKRVYTNREEYQSFQNAESSVEKLKNAENTKYILLQPKLADCETNIDTELSSWKRTVEMYTDLTDYVYIVAVDMNLPIQDSFYVNAQYYEQYSPNITSVLAAVIIGSLLILVSLVWLTAVAGRRDGDEELHLAQFDHWKTELAAGTVIGLWIMITYAFANTVGSRIGGQITYATGYYAYAYTMADRILIGMLAFYTAAMFLWGYLSLVRRMKAKTVWKNSLLRAVLRFVSRTITGFWTNRSLLVRVLLIFGGFVLIHWLAYTGTGMFVALAFAAEAAGAYFFLKDAVDRAKIQKGIKEIAEGNVEYQIPLKGLKGSNRESAEMVNHIGEGLNRAVEASMKSERLKTDLITNVSHDIKTPLTSIINYIDLLKRENIEDPKIQGYLDILEAKAQRLKTLTEDVVEASKASSGNITLEKMDVNLVEMLNQTIGEFAEKLKDKNLEIVETSPEEPVLIYVDGRRMWRVLENIFNNTVKYAMPGTRVYADLKVIGQKAELSLKNISEQPLNISADELTERFIRGDISRNTEGSGLGLSIAKTLTELQGGTFDLYLDGDLFKVVITFTKK